MSQFFEELKRRKVVRVGIAYLVGAWVLLQVTDVVVPILELPNWTARVVLYGLAAGFIISLILAWVFELTRSGIKRDRGAVQETATAATAGQKIEHGVVAVLAMALLGIALFWFIDRDARWARDEAIPRIEQYVSEGNWEAAYQLAKQVEGQVPGDAGMAELWGEFSWTVSIPSSPPGATVYRRPYSETDSEWEVLGTTPLTDIHFPFGLSQVRMELPGHRTLLRLLGGQAQLDKNPELDLRNKRSYEWYSRFYPEIYVFDSINILPEKMVRVPGWTTNLDGAAVEFGDFFIDRFEVSNREFKDFVDAGGYQNRAYWENEFVDGDKTLSWEEAMALFVDSSGRPGPGTWQAGSFPDSEENFPVSGVSWYEAAAYAKFRKSELPSYQHWHRALADGALTWMLPASNLDSDGVATVGQHQGIGWTGTYDLAGNVREWCYNAIGNDRVILGGGWNDSQYVVHESVLDPGSASPLDRSPINGFRLAKTFDENDRRTYVNLPVPEPAKPEISDPVSDAVFEVYRQSYEYDSPPLNDSLEETEETRHWVREQISFDASYGGERITLHLFLPMQQSEQYQTVLFWPSIGGFIVDAPRVSNPVFEYLLRNGRAVAYPIIQGTFGRRAQEFPDWMSVAGRELVFEQLKDFRRTIDYLETRSDIDSDALAFLGVSYGGRLGGLVLAIEPRLRVGILNQAGINFEVRSEIDVTHYLPRVNQPVIQFNGRFDTDFRFDTSAKPFFDLLGTADEHKKHVVYPTGHFVPIPVAIGESLDFLDKYFGPPIEQPLISSADQ